MIDLHVHTKYSLLDSTIKPLEMMKRLKEIDRKAICVTEHGNLYSSVVMYKLCKEHGIKYLMGCEMYICDDVNEKNKDSKYNHLILIAKNETGRLNLNKLVSESSKYKYYGKPRIDFNMLKEYKDGLVVTSACMAGEVSRALQDGDKEKAKAIASKYLAEFGEDYYLEYQSHNSEEQQGLNRDIVDLANSLGIKYIVTSDAHYLTKEEQRYHDVFVQIGTSREAGEIYEGCYIQTEAEILDKCKSTTGEENLRAIETTHEIAEKCNVEIPLSAPIMPHVEVPNKFKSEGEYLKYLCAQGWHARKLNELSEDKQEIYKKRLQYEMDVILRMGFEGYFLLVESYVTSVKRRGIARGSAGGSLVAYLTHIVDIDPIKYGLYFERFIDVGMLDMLEQGKIKPEQLKIPDVDTDFGKQDRDTIMQNIVGKYGGSKVSSLGVFQYIWAKGAIKDIGKVLDIPYAKTDEMSKKLGDLTIREALDVGILDKYKEEYPKLFEYAEKLAGLPKSFGSHPCGKVISMDDTMYYNAIEYDDDGIAVIQCDMNSADDLGLVKIDLLGLRTVDVIYDVLDMIGKDYNYIAPHMLNFEDEKVLEQFRLGNTAGIFQFESPGMRGTLRNIEVSRFEDLIVANALYRPGSMDFISNYADRKKGLEDFEYLHPDLEPILKNTYAIITFQEQLLEIGKLANLSNPDELRKGTAKKDEKLMKKLFPELKQGLMSRDWTEEQVDELWEIMLRFAKYSFNKSHSAAYAMIAYITMYLKVYHPKEFLVAWINSYNGKIDKIGECIEEAKRLNVDVKIPSWRNLTDETTIKDGEVYTGTKSIKFLNANLAHELSKLSNNKYDTFLDLLNDINNETSVTNKHKDILIKLGCFDEFGTPKKLLNIIELADWIGRKQLSKAQLDKVPFKEDQIRQYADETPKQFRNINFEAIVQQSIPSLKDEEFNIIEKMNIELDYLGYIKTKLPGASSEIGVITKVDRNIWGTTFVDFYRISDGESSQMKITKKVFNDRPLSVLDIIKTIEIKEQAKKRKVDGKWIDLDETERILTKWAKVKI